VLKDEAGFLQAILAAPEDTALRLVYADWLEERGDIRGEFVRLDVALRAMPGDAVDYAALAMRWEELRTQMSPAWLLAVLGDEAQIPLPLRGWYLGDYLLPYDWDAYLKLYADGFWIYTDSYETAFSFDDFLASLDLEGVKAQFPRGHTARNGRSINYQTGRYRRSANRLELSSWDEQAGVEYAWFTLSIVSPERLLSEDNQDSWVFIPEATADPAPAPDRGGR
jgi:uncharacterized protein (TIGR02996 family)